MSATAENAYGRPSQTPDWGMAPVPGPKLRRLWEAWWAMPKGFRIAAMVLGFIAWWPIGLTLLAVTATGRFGRHRSGRYEARSGGCGWNQERPPASSGNRAFDDYRAETLRRLEDEQRDFGAFLERLRLAKDKAEFEQFMTDRRRPPAPAPAPEPQPQA